MSATIFLASSAVDVYGIVHAELPAERHAAGIVGGSQQNDPRAVSLGQHGTHQSDRPRSGNGDHVGRLDRRQLDHRLQCASERLAKGAGFEVQIVGQGEDDFLADAAVFCEAAVHAAAHGRSVDAEKRCANLTVAAMSAEFARRRVHRHAVAHFEACDAGPHFGDRAAQLVAEDHRRLDDIFALENVDIGSTHARVMDLDDHVARSGLRVGHVDQFHVPRLQSSLDDGFHVSPPESCRRSKHQPTPNRSSSPRKWSKRTTSENSA